MRTIYIKRVVHTQKELGHLEKEVTAARERRYGREYTQQLNREADSFWQVTSDIVLSHSCTQRHNAKKLHLFADSIPDAQDSMIRKAISELAAKHIPMHQLLAALIKRGASVHGTEDLDLLRQESAYATAVFHGSPRCFLKEEELLDSRDRAIAERIDKIVPNEEGALLFIGALHDVGTKLFSIAPDFVVAYL